MDKLNQWLTLVANIGVMVGIVILAIEINQNTQTLRAEAIQRSTEVSRQQLMMIAGDPEIVRIIMTEDLSLLTEVERERARWINRSFMAGMQGLYRQWTLGILPDEDWQNWNRIICRNAQTRHFREVWDPSGLIPSFVQYVRQSCPALAGS